MATQEELLQQTQDLYDAVVVLRNETSVLKTQAQSANAQAQSAVTTAEGHASAALQSENNAGATATTTIGVRDAAVVARNEANSAKAVVLTKAAETNADALTAASAKTAAAASAIKADNFANYPRDQIVPGETGYSGRHWYEAVEELVAGSTGDIIFLGSWDAAVSGTPPTPAQSVRYLVISDGIVDGKNVSDGDYIVYDVANTNWIVTVNAGRVASVNGYVGPVTLDYGDFAGNQSITLQAGAKITSATGFWAPNNQGLVGHSTGGTSYNIARIDSSNLMQLGNTNFSARLHSNGVPKWYDGSVNTDLLHTGGGQNTKGVNFTSSVSLTNASGYYGKLADNTWSLLAMVSSGNVNIFGSSAIPMELRASTVPVWRDGTGTTQLIHAKGGQSIAGDTSILGNLAVGSGRLNINPAAVFAPSNGSSKTAVLIENQNGAENLAFAMRGDDATDRMMFLTDHGSSGTFTERMTILASNGRVGINNTAPGYQLDVNGDGYFGGGLTVIGSGTIGGTDFNSGWLKIGNATTGWAFDSNEIYSTGAASIGTLAGNLTLKGADGVVISGSGNLTVNGDLNGKKISSNVYGNTVLGNSTGAATSNYITHGTSGSTVIRSYDGSVYDTACYVTGPGNLVLNKSLYGGDATTIYLGDQSDLQIRHNGTHGYIDNYTGALYLRQLDSAQNMVMQVKDTGGTVRTVAQGQGNTANPYFRAMYGGTEKMRTISTGLQVYGTLTADDVALSGGGTFGSHITSNSQNAGIKFNYVANAATPAYDSTGSSITGGADFAGLGKRNNIDVQTWYGFSVSPTYGSGTVARGSPAFSVDARSGNCYVFGKLAPGSFEIDADTESEFMIRRTAGSGQYLSLYTDASSGNLLSKSSNGNPKAFFIRVDDGTGQIANYQFRNGADGDDILIGGNYAYHEGRKPTAGDIGAAEASHTHSYLPLSGGQVTGQIDVRNTSTQDVWSLTGSQAGAHIQIYQSNAGHDAAITFHVNGDYATHFGLDGSTNRLTTSGWSSGSTKKHLACFNMSGTYAQLSYSDGSDPGWIRTGANGLISASAGTGSLGTTSWRWNVLYANNGYFTNDWEITSDGRVKENLRDIAPAEAAAKLNKLGAAQRYDRIDTGNKNELGTIAQWCISAGMADVVNFDKEIDRYSVKYRGLQMYQLSARLDDVRRITELEAANDALHERLERLEALLGVA